MLIRSLFPSFFKKKAGLRQQNQSFSIGPDLVDGSPKPNSRKPHAFFFLANSFLLSFLFLLQKKKTEQQGTLSPNPKFAALNLLQICM